MKRTGWISTYSGNKFHIFNPKLNDIDVNDIAHCLSMLCRFNGHCQKFYSVANHSVLVSQIIDPQYALEGLMHDATEAFIGDMVRPLKVWMQDFMDVEHKIERAIDRRFKLNSSKVCKRAIKVADNIALITEARDLVNQENCLWEFGKDITPIKQKIVPWSQSKSEKKFLERFYQLTCEN